MLSPFRFKRHFLAAPSMDGLSKSSHGSEHLRCAGAAALLLLMLAELRFSVVHDVPRLGHGSDDRRGERYCAGAPVRWGSPAWRSRFLSRRSVPARIRSRAVRAADARSSAFLSNLRGRPGGRRIRLNASRSFGKMAHTRPTLTPYRRRLSSNRRTYASDALSAVAASETERRLGRSIPRY
jgi:hypothetical protein